MQEFNSKSRVLDLTVDQLETIIFDKVADVVRRLPSANDVYITREEAKIMLRCSLPKIHEHMNNGKIRYSKDGRRTLIERESVVELIARNKVR